MSPAHHHHEKTPITESLLFVNGFTSGINKEGEETFMKGKIRLVFDIPGKAIWKDHAGPFTFWEDFLEAYKHRTGKDFE